MASTAACLSERTFILAQSWAYSSFSSSNVGIVGSWSVGHEVWVQTGGFGHCQAVSRCSHAPLPGMKHRISVTMRDPSTLEKAHKGQTIAKPARFDPTMSA